MRARKSIRMGIWLLVAAAVALPAARLASGQTTPVINLGSGFTAGAMTLNGSATLNGTRLRLTNG
jgi:hypothetical protein